MTKLMTTLTITIITTMLLTGGIDPYAFSTGGYNDDDDDDLECGCDKPSIFTVEYDGPAADKIEIFKKKKDFNNNSVAATFTVDDLGNPISSGSKITINSEDHLGKKKMSSNTYYKVSQSNGEEAKFVIHTSCSKPLFVGQVHDQKNGSDFEGTLTVVGGYDLEGDETMYSDYSCDIRDHQNDLSECDGTLINFDDNNQTPHATLLSGINSSTEFIENGVSLENPEEDNPEGVPPQGTIAIYDSAPGSGSDGDLEVNIGNLAIIPDNVGNPDPHDLSDSANGGEQVYTFNPPKNIRSFVWVDQDSSNEIIHVTARDSNGGLILDLPTISPPVGNENAKRIVFTADNTSELRFDYSGSGGVTNICITDPPVPEKGSIMVSKTVVGAIPQNPFNFKFTNTTMHETLFTLNSGDSMPFGNLVPGDYMIEELAHSGYTLDIVCLGAASSESGDEVTVTIVEHEDVSCDFTNTEIVPAMITLKKTITNDNTSDADSKGPTDFILNVTNVDTDVTTVISHGVKTNIDPGTYVMGEISPDNYSFVLIAGDTGCPSMLDMDEFTISANEHLTCTIYNDDDFVPGGNEGDPPTMKITVQVNGLEGVTTTQFNYTIGTQMMKGNGDTVNIPINTPVIFNQTNFIDPNDPNITQVLPSAIEGDGNCPDVLGTGENEQGFLTLSANQNIECVIVYGKAIEPGVVFHFDSLRFDSDTIFFPPSTPPDPDDLDKCDSTESVLPCIVYNAVTDRLNVVPNITTEQFRVTTLVQLNIIAIAADNTMIDLNGQAICELEGIGISPQGKPAFVFDCQNLMSEENQFRVNYALIETLQLGKTLT